MSQSAPQAPAPAPAPAAPKKGWFKAILFGILGLGSGVVGMYATAVVDRVVKPPKPVANFAVVAEGLTITCQNHASGESGWWDFGDGTPLEPFTPDAPVTHAYTKPGSYSVKLTVRNFLAEENERSVPVDVTAGSTPANAPQIGAFVVQPVSPVSFAPATFRLSADVVNASSCVWDLGDGRVEVTPAGKIDRLVTFEKPGDFAISLVAHNGKQAAKQASAVKVEAPREGTTLAVLKVTDTGSKLDRLVTTESVAIPLPKDKATQFSKSVSARPGFTLAEATLVDTSASGVKNLRVQVAPDKRLATISGDWSGDAKSTNKAAGGSDVLVRVKLTQDRVIPQQPAVTMVTGSFVLAGSALRADLPLPPAPLGLGGHKREFQLEICTMRDGKMQTILQAPQGGAGALAFPWSTSQQGPGWTLTYNAKVEGQTVVVTAAQR